MNKSVIQFVGRLRVGVLQVVWMRVHVVLADVLDVVAATAARFLFRLQDGVVSSTRGNVLTERSNLRLAECPAADRHDTLCSRLALWGWGGSGRGGAWWAIASEDCRC